MLLLVHAESMAVNRNVREKPSIYLFVFEIQQWAVKGTQMFLVSIRITTIQTQQRYAAIRHSSVK